MADQEDRIKALTAAVQSLLELQLHKERAEAQTSTSSRAQTMTDLYNQLSTRVEKYAYGSGDEVKPFPKWLLRYEYTIVTEAASLPPEMQTRLVLDKLGQIEFDRLMDHVAPTDPSKMLQKDLLDTLKVLFRDKVPLTRRRIEVLNYRYDRSVPITEHIDKINRHAAEFDRAKLSDDGLRTLLLLQSFCFSQENEQLKKIALRVIERDQNATMKDIVAELEAHLNVANSLKTLENPVTSAPVAALSVVKSRTKCKVKSQRDNSVKNQCKPNISMKCNGCGGAHPRAKCNFRDAICHSCSKTGHIASVCQSEARSSKAVNKNGRVKTQAISAIGKSRRRYVAACFGNKNVRLQYDTGSDITIIGRDVWYRLGSPKLSTTEIVEHAGGGKLNLIGRFRAPIRVLGRSAKVDIDVAAQNNINLFGLNAIDDLGLWSVPLKELHGKNSVSCIEIRNSSDSTTVNAASQRPVPVGGETSHIGNKSLIEDIRQSFPKLFSNELGTCTDFRATFRLKDNPQPVQIPCRSVPYAMEKLLEEELQRLESAGIIERVETSSWSSPIVIVKKQNGQIRLCADYSTGVNRALLDNRHPLPNVDGVMAKLNGNCFFSILDLKDAFFQIMIAEDQREITTIVTPKGLFRFLRLPFGIKTAPATFQQAIEFTLSGLEGVAAYLDDVIVSGRTREEHDQRLRMVLQRMEERGWRLHREKCSFGVKEIKYLGLIINAKGMSADPESTRAIANMPNPSNISEMQSLLGMVNHYGKFIPHLHQIKQPLEELTRKNCPWEWRRKHDTAMQQIKQVMLSPLLLEHYDPSKTLVVAADACSTGIGAVLLQRDTNGHERAVYHMAQSLTDSQRNYSQLEKEALALVTAVERFHKYVWGRRFILQTDHKPLMALLGTENTGGLKPTTAARLKRWALRLLGYDFHIEYIRTQDFGQADALSRLIEKFRRDNADELQVASVRAVETELLQVRNLSIDFFGEELRQNLRTATKEDPLLNKVFQAIRGNKWHTFKSDDVQSFHRRCEDLSIVDDTLMLGDRVVIPQKLQPTVLRALHKGHPGIRRMKQLAREFTYWPTMNKDIEYCVRQCNPCALTQKMPRKVPMEPWPAPKRPMERVHLDYAGPIGGRYILVVVDAFSKFFDVAITPTISAERTVKLCREIFARYGSPDILVTDHGSQFTAQIFKAFCAGMQTTHLLSPINHPQSNGQAERMVDTLKRAIARNPSDWESELYDFLYSYRYTPSSAAPGGKSPAELFFGRRMDSPFTRLLPKHREEALPQRDHNREVMRQQFAKHQGARPRSLAVGDRVAVLIRKDKRELGTITSQQSRSCYTILLDDGRTLTRHIDHIWRGGGSDSVVSGPTEEDQDEWTFHQRSTRPETASEATPPINAGQEDTQPAVRSPVAPALQPTPARPTRVRARPTRLILDPQAKSYTRW